MKFDRHSMPSLYNPQAFTKLLVSIAFAIGVAYVTAALHWLSSMSVKDSGNLIPRSEDQTRLKKGTAFAEQERDMFGFDRLLTLHIGILRTRTFGASACSTRAKPLLTGSEDVSLLDVVRNRKVTAVAGVSAQAGAFSEKMVREMTKHTETPIIFPLSNLTSQPEATPADLLQRTEGRALVGTLQPVSGC